MKQAIMILIFSVMSVGSLGAETYPNKPVRLIVPFAPGGGNDLVARVVAQYLTNSLRQQFIVDNRPGGGGVLGTGLAARATPDGYTLLLGHTGTLAINPAMQQGLGYDPITDFAPISLIGYTALILVVHPKIQARSVYDLISLARSNPKQLNFASGGIGTVSHLSGEMFKSKAGLEIIHVAYRGTGPAITELIGGQVQLMFSVFPAALPHIKTNRLTALAITSLERSRVLPTIPTVSESGLRGFESVSRYGLLSAKGTPVETLEKLNKEMEQLARTADFVSMLNKSAVESAHKSLNEYAQIIQQELAHWQPVVNAAGMKKN